MALFQKNQPIAWEHNKLATNHSIWNELVTLILCETIWPTCGQKYFEIPCWVLY